MVKYQDPALDAVFAALADSTRRGILESLSSGGDVAVSELAAPYEMSLPGFMKHLKVLEDAGLVTRTKEGRVVNCTLEAQPLKQASDWVARSCSPATSNRGCSRHAPPIRVCWQARRSYWVWPPSSPAGCPHDAPPPWTR